MGNRYVVLEAVSQSEKLVPDTFSRSGVGRYRLVMVLDGVLGMQMRVRQMRGRRLD